MAINKEKNVLLQITIPKDDASQLETLRLAFAENGIKVSKSEILVQALRNYIKILVMCGAPKEHKEEEEPQGEKKDA